MTKGWRGRRGRIKVLNEKTEYNGGLNGGMRLIFLSFCLFYIGGMWDGEVDGGPKNHNRKISCNHFDARDLSFLQTRVGSHV